MKAKTIKAVLRKKIDEWIATIDDNDLKERVRKNTIVTGGAIASMLLREPVNDYDVYFRDWETTVRVAQYYVNRFEPIKKHGIPCRIYVSDGLGVEIKDVLHPPREADSAEARVKIFIKSAGIASEDGAEKPYEYFESRPEGEAQGYIAEVMQDPGDIQDTYEETEQASLDIEDDGKSAYRPVFMSTNAITLSNRLQVVIRFWGDPDKIHNNYDFAHCTNYWQSWDNTLTLRPAALEALLTRELRYVGSRYPICSLIRIRKFVARGWTINAGQVLKAVMQAAALDLKNIHVLEDQLTGVDAAYFLEVIAKLKEKDPDKVDSAYLIEIIDRMF